MKTWAAQLVAASAAVAVLCSSASSAPGNTWWVDVNGTAPGTGTFADPYTSIHYAVQQATTSTGDLILVEPGTYRETVVIDHKYITLRSTAGPGLTKILAEGQGTVLTVIGSAAAEDSVTVEGFQFVGGSGSLRAGLTTGGGVLAEEVELYLSHSVMRENRALLGGGLAADAAEVHLVDVQLSENFAESEWLAADGKGGGIFVRTGGRIVMEEVLVRDNQAGAGGGLYAQDSTLEIDTSQIRNNVAFGATFDGLGPEGGGLYAVASVVDVHGSHVQENLALGPAAMGGGLRFALEGDVYLRSSVITDNEAGDIGPESALFGCGGGIASDVLLEAYDLEIQRNEAERGGGVFGSGFYLDCRIGWNKARLGGGAYTSAEEAVFGGLLISESAIRENDADWPDFGGAGGGVYGPGYVEHSRIFGNFALGNGGGAHGATLVDCEVFENHVLAPEFQSVARGGGVYAGYVERSILRDNWAESSGGIAKGGGASDVILVLTQIYDNEAPYGGGAHNSLLDRCTVYGNAGPLGGAGLFFDWQGYVTSSIVWANVGDEILDTYGVDVEWANVQGGWTGLGNTAVDPLFRNAAARNFHLRPASPCIDHGDPTVYDADGTRCDQGALPYDQLRIQASRTDPRLPTGGAVQFE